MQMLEKDPIHWWPILAYKISNFWSNSPHTKGGFIVVQTQYSTHNMIQMGKTTNIRLNKNQYPLV